MKILKNLLRRIAPRTFANIESLVESNQKLSTCIASVEAKTEMINQKLIDLQQRLDQRDSRLDILKQQIGGVEHYQPIYGITGLIDTPQRDCIERARAIENHLQPVAGKKVLDVGSSLGYFSFYLADRGASVEAWESNAGNNEVAQQASIINGIHVDFKTKELNHQSIQTIPAHQFDTVLMLSVFHHITHIHGLAYTQQLVKELMHKVPVMIVELAKQGEAPGLFWDKDQPNNELDIFALVRDEVKIKKLGEFSNHVSKNTRPMYAVEIKKAIKVNQHTYDYEYSTKEAYANSPMARLTTGRRYYYSEDVVIKECLIDKAGKYENQSQILNEIAVLSGVLEGRHKIYKAPKLLGFEINKDYIRIVLARVGGKLLSDFNQPVKPAVATRLAKDVLKTLADLHSLGFSHNDVRSWNVIVNDSGRAWLIDYGLVGPKTEDDAIALLWTIHVALTGESEPTAPYRSLPPAEPFAVSESLAELHRQIRAKNRDYKNLAKLI